MGNGVAQLACMTLTCFGVCLLLWEGGSMETGQATLLEFFPSPSTLTEGLTKPWHVQDEVGVCLKPKRKQAL